MHDGIFFEKFLFSKNDHKGANLAKFSKSYFWIFESGQLNDGQIQACNQILVNLFLLEHHSKSSWKKFSLHISKKAGKVH